MRIQPTGFVTITCLIMSFFTVRLVSANPSSKEPNRPLAAHATISESEEMVAALYKVYDEEEKFVIQTFAKRNNPASFSDRQISRASGRLWKARRDAKHLQLMGEPAGHDLYRKLFMLAVEVDKFGMSYRSTPRGSQLVQRIALKLNKEKPRMAKFLQQAQNALNQGKLEIVEKQMESKGVALYEDLVYFSPSARKPYNTQFYQVLGECDTKLTSKRKSDYIARAKEAMATQVTAAVDFPAEAKRVRDEIASGGTAKLAGDKTGGPVEAFAYVANLWGNASAGLIRANAISWAFTNRVQTQIQPNPSQLKTAALQSLASIIEAAAVSTPPDKVQAVYSDLLKQISVVERRSGPYSKDVGKACTPALAKLAARDPALGARITAYGRATSEALRWRRLFASQQAKNLAKEFPTTSQLLAGQSEAGENFRPEFVRAFGRKSVNAPSSFSEPANWMTREAAPRLLGKPVTEEGMIRLTPTSRTAVVPHGARHYGNVPVPMPSEAEVQDLQAALVIDETHGPLTPDSADAVSAAEMHDYVSVSGLIQSVHLESAVTRFVGLPDIAYPLASLGKTPEMDPSLDPLSQTCWRVDLKPLWAHHRFFTVRVKSNTK